MPSQHEQVVVEVVNKIALSGSPWGPLLLETAARMNAGFYPTWLIDSVLQKGRRGAFDQYDAYSFLLFLGHLYKGELYSLEIPVGSQPHANKMVVENDRALSQLPTAFRASFVGGLAEDDGHFEWGKPLVMQRRVLDRNTDVEEMSDVLVKPNCVPLEVGSTKASRTITHIRMRGGVARWPYGYESIYLFVLSKDAKFIDE